MIIFLHVSWFLKLLYTLTVWSLIYLTKKFDLKCLNSNQYDLKDNSQFTNWLHVEEKIVFYQYKGKL